jgi:hypothetical protein
MKKIILISVTILVAVIVLSINWYLKTKEKNERYAKHYLEYDISIFSEESEQKSKERRDKFHAKLMEIREKYKADIFPHRDKLREIMKNRTKENYKRIFSIIPTKPPYALSEPGAYLPNGIYNQSKIGFSWQLFRSQSDPDSVMDQISLKPYMEKGDTPLSISSGAGRKQMILWISGRVTEKTMEDNPAIFKPIRVPIPAHIYVDREIEPPFDFLKP